MLNEMNPFRILLLTTCYPSYDEDPSGVFLAKLAAAIRKKGHSITVLAPSDGTNFGKLLVDEIETYRFGYFWPRSMLRLTRGSGGIPENMAKSWLARIQLYPMMIMFLLHALLRIRDCDLIYANWLGAGIIGAVVNVFTAKPMVISFRGDDGYLARDRLLWRVLTKWVSSRSGVIAPVSQEIVNILIQLGIDQEKLALPRFGVDTELFYPEDRRNRHADRIQLVFVGAVIFKKGPQDLVQALADPCFSNVDLVIVGDGDLRPELLNMCNRLGMIDRVEWKGTRSPAEVAEILRSSDILCLPSYTEGQPNVIKEAMASGLPVIATRVGGIPELVDEGKTGFLFNPGNIDELRECASRLIADKHLRLSMGLAGNKLIHQKGITWDSTAEDFDAIFYRLTGKAA